MKTAVLCAFVLALLCTAAFAQTNPLEKVTSGVTKAANTTAKGVGTGVGAVTNGTKGAIDGAKGATDAIGSISKKNTTGVDGVKNGGSTGKPKSAAGYAAPAVGVFAAAGLGSLLLLAL